VSVGSTPPRAAPQSLLKESQVITGKDLIKRKEDKELALFQEAQEFEERHRKSKNS